MLRLRICPECQKETRSPLSFFCHRCGAELPSPPPTPAPTALAKKESPPRPGRADVSKKVFAVLLGALVLAASAAAVYFFSGAKVPPSNNLPSVKTDTREAVVSGKAMPFENHPFSAKGLSEITPAEADFYLEGSDISAVLPYLLGKDDLAKVNKVLSDETNLNLPDVASFLENEFAVVREGTASAFLAKVKDADFVSLKVREAGEVEGFKPVLVGGFLVVADSEELAGAIRDSLEKLSLNLSLTAPFTEARRSLPPSGQLFFYGPKIPWFLPPGAGPFGAAGVISRRGEDMIITGWKF